jgi:hypothetical protein
LIQRKRNATHRAPVNKGIEIVGSLRSAALLQAVVTTAELCRLWRVDAPQSDMCSMNFQRVAVNNTGLPNQVVTPADAARRNN